MSIKLRKIRTIFTKFPKKKFDLKLIQKVQKSFLKSSNEQFEFLLKDSNGQIYVSVKTLKNMECSLPILRL